MFNLIPVSTSDILIALGIFLALVILSLLIFRCLWLKTTDFYFPADHSDDDEGEIINGLGEVRLEGLTDYFRALFKRICWLDSRYWIRSVGFEGRPCSSGFSFLLFQRKLMIVFTWFTIGNWLLFVSFYCAIYSAEKYNDNIS